MWNGSGSLPEYNSTFIDFNKFYEHLYNNWTYWILFFPIFLFTVLHPVQVYLARRSSPPPAAPVHLVDDGLLHRLVPGLRPQASPDRRPNRLRAGSPGGLLHSESACDTQINRNPTYLGLDNLISNCSLLSLSENEKCVRYWSEDGIIMSNTLLGARPSFTSVCMCVSDVRAHSATFLTTFQCSGFQIVFVTLIITLSLRGAKKSSIWVKRIKGRVFEVPFFIW